MFAIYALFQVMDFMNDFYQVVDETIARYDVYKVRKKETMSVMSRTLGS